jgi:hypothetical protein
MFVGEPEGFTWLGWLGFTHLPTTHALAYYEHQSVHYTPQRFYLTGQILFQIVVTVAAEKKSQIMTAIVVKNLINFYAFVPDKTVTLDVNITFLKMRPNNGGGSSNPKSAAAPGACTIKLFYGRNCFVIS